jgi:cyclophilin family peptidyl-prolyl cis-trans isomerase
MSRILVVLMLIAIASSMGHAQDAAPPAEGDATAPADAQATGENAAADAAASGDQTTDVAGEAAPAAAPAASPEATAANEAFEALVDQWNAAIAALRALQQQRDAAAGQARADLEAKMSDQRRETSALVDKISDAGLAVYKLDAESFPRVNGTLITIAKFHVIGDANGDGGDQYEKALPLTEGLIDAGAGEKFPQLYLFAGFSAFNIGELDKAETYLKKAEEVGLFANVAPANEPPSAKLLFDASENLKRLSEHREHWVEEQKIRAAEVAADDLPRVKMSTTKGDIVIELFENEAPQSVASFLTLVKDGFYDGVTFHRVLPLFMAQGGDPEGTGGGGPGYNITDEQGLPQARRHFRGSMSMANTGQPNSGGSQFFLTFVPTSYLDGRHAVFGRVIEGIDVAASLKRRDPTGPGPKPMPDKILKAEVLRDRGHEYEFEKLPE